MHFSFRSFLLTDTFEEGINLVHRGIAGILISLLNILKSVMYNPDT